MKNMSKDIRAKLWSQLEKEIQYRAQRKDKSFKLCGKWKKYIRTQEGYKIFAVDGRWLRNNVSVYFGHREHGLVDEFIPLDEIWVSTRHFYEGNSQFAKCPCKVKRRNQKVSKKYFESTIIHEIMECEEIKKRKPYWPAHQIALRAEKEAGLLSDPYDDS